MGKSFLTAFRRLGVIVQTAVFLGVPIFLCRKCETLDCTGTSHDDIRV
jgi:hypothetical protein